MAKVIDLETGELVEAANQQLTVEAALSGNMPDIQAPTEREVAPTRTPEEANKIQRERIEALPELGSGGLLSGEDSAKIAAISPVILSATDPKEIAKIISSNFPNIGITETPEGETLATNNKTGVTVVVNKPGLSKLDIMQGLGIVAAFTPAGMAKKAVTRVAGAAGTESAIQVGQSISGGEFDEGDVALAAGLGVVGEAVEPFIKGLKQARQEVKEAAEVGVEREAIKEVEPAIKEAQEASEATGVGLFEAQKTVVPSRLEEQSFVASLPEGTRTARAALLKQNEQAAKAVDDLLDIIAPASALETGAERFRSASKKAGDALKVSRKEKTSPIYVDSFGDKDPIDVSGVIDNIDGISKSFPEGGQVRSTLAKVKKFISGAKNTEQLHNAKIEIDQMFEKVGDGALGNNTKRILTEIKDDLLFEMDSQNPLYKQAREEFEKLSPEVTRYEQSVLGKISAMEDGQLKSISKNIFDPAQTNPAIIRNAKKTIEKIDPDAWREITRTELERRLGSIRFDREDVAEGAAASIENIPSQLSRAIFGNEKQRKVLYQGAPSDVVESLRYLEVALNRAKLGRPGGSQTATREEIKKQLRPGIVQGIRNFMQSPIATIAGAGEEAAFNKKVASLSKALYDPEWVPRMKKIRKMPQGSMAAEKAMLQLLNDVESSEEE